MGKKDKETSKAAGAGGEAAGAEVGFLKLWVSRGRAAGALIGFAIVAWVSHRAGIGLTDSALRGLVGAVAFSFVGWLCALMIITGLLRTAARDKNEREAALAEAAQAQAQMAPAGPSGPHGAHDVPESASDPGLAPPSADAA